MSEVPTQGQHEWYGLQFNIVKGPVHDLFAIGANPVSGRHRLKAPYVYSGVLVDLFDELAMAEEDISQPLLVKVGDRRVADNLEDAAEVLVDLLPHGLAHVLPYKWLHTVDFKAVRGGKAGQFSGAGLAGEGDDGLARGRVLGGPHLGRGYIFKRAVTSNGIDNVRQRGGGRDAVDSDAAPVQLRVDVLVLESGLPRLDHAQLFMLGFV